MLCKRPLNDPYEEDHQGFDGFVAAWKCFLHLAMVLRHSLPHPTLSVCLRSCLLFIHQSFYPFFIDLSPSVSIRLYLPFFLFVSVSLRVNISVPDCVFFSFLIFF